MNRSLLALQLLLLSMGVGPWRAQAEPTIIVLDGTSAGRVFEGLGAVSAGASSRLLIDYPEPQRSEVLDYLFKPGYGAALQRLKVEIGADVNSTDGAEPSHQRSSSDHDITRGYEGWLMREAQRRNPNIILEALPWGAPHWVGRNLYTQGMAHYVVNYIESMQRQYSLVIAYVGIWNEKKADIGYVKSLRALLDQHHLSTKIVCCDDDWAIAEELSKDGALDAAVYALGAHYPRTKEALTTTTAAARHSNKPLWSSEDQPNQGTDTVVSRDWPIGGRIMAHRYNENYLKGGLTATEIWSPVTSYYDNLAAPNSGLMYANTPWSGHYDVQSTIWVTAHTTQFAQPGWQYLDASSADLSHGSYVTLRAPDKRNWSVVLETIGAPATQPLSFRLTGGLADSVVHIWETNSRHVFELIADVTPHEGVFAYNFEPDAIYSLTTTTGQGRGTAQPPRDKPLPLPYADDFESTQVGRSPKFWADQNGAFESQPCQGRPGRCLTQVVLAEPIAWGASPEPYTLMGNSEWADYGISVEVRIPARGEAILMGRIDSADTFANEAAKAPSGYRLRLHADGRWQLASTSLTKPDTTLASGRVKPVVKGWHRISLDFRGTKISASFDRQTLAQRVDGSHQRGMVAVGSSWNRVAFDNVQVSPR